MSGNVGRGPHLLGIGPPDGGTESGSGAAIVVPAPSVGLGPAQTLEGRLAVPTPPSSDPYEAGAAAVAAYVGRQLSPRSRATALDALRRIVRLVTGGRESDPRAVPWGTWGYQQVTLVRTGLFEMSRAGVITPGTANLTLSHLRGLIRAMYGMGIITAAQHELSHSDATKNIRGSRVTRGRALSFAEEKALRKAASGLPGYRPLLLNTAMTLAIGTGVRRDEIATLPLGAFKEPGTVIVVGKGNKERRIPFGEQVQTALDAWLEERAQLAPKHVGFFCAVGAPNAMLSRWGFWSLVRTAAHIAFGGGEACGENCRCLDVVTGPHDFRRTFATRMLERGVDIRELQRLMGHESPETTARYDKRDLDELFVKVRKMRIFDDG